MWPRQLSGSGEVRCTCTFGERSRLLYNSGVATPPLKGWARPARRPRPNGLRRAPPAITLYLCSFLVIVDEQWSVVKMQTSWSLELYFAPNETVRDGPSASPSESEPSTLPVSNNSPTASDSNSPEVTLDTSVNETETVSSHHSPKVQRFLDPK